NSPALAAAAADSLSDAGATTAVLVGALAAHFFDLRVDGAVGLLVAALILRAGWGVAKDTLNPLVGQAPDPDLIRQISADILCHPQIRGIHDLILHDYGPGRAIMSLHVEMAVDAVSPNVMDLHNAIDAIEREIQETYQIETSIHMDPIVISGAQVSQIRGRVADLVRGIDPALNIRNFCMTPGARGANLVFDVVVPPSVSLTDEQVADAVKQSVAAMEGGIYCAVVQINHI
ncbi:MAG: cation transporter, partial [Clostridiales bacterium]|nr:cation transporter [Clostridiales bacterium]